MGRGPRWPAREAGLLSLSPAMGCRLTPLWMPAPPVLASPALGGVRQAHGTGSVTARWLSAPRVARKGGHSRHVEPLRAVSEAAPPDLRSWRFSGSWPGTWALGHLLRCTVSLVRWTTAIPSSPRAGPSDRVKPEAPSAGPWVTASDWPGLPRAPLGSGAFSGGCGVQAVSPSSQEIPWGHRALHSSGRTGLGPRAASRWWTCSPRTRPRGAPSLLRRLPRRLFCRVSRPVRNTCSPEAQMSTPVSHTPLCYLTSPCRPPKLGSESQAASLPAPCTGALWASPSSSWTGVGVFRDSEIEVEMLGHRP